MSAIPHPFGGVPKINGDDLSPTEANAIADSLVLAPNFVDGGATYSPATVNGVQGEGIRFGGAGNGKVPRLTSRVLTRQVAFQPLYKAGDWDTAAGASWYVVQAVTGKTLTIDVELPDGCVVNEFHAILDGAPAHGALPGAMPSVALVKTDFTSGSVLVPTIVSTQTDTSASVAAYELAHTVSKTGLTETVTRSTHRYFIAITGEGGANFVAGLAVYAVKVVYTIAAMDPGGA